MYFLINQHPRTGRVTIEWTSDDWTTSDCDMFDRNNEDVELLLEELVGMGFVQQSFREAGVLA